MNESKYSRILKMTLDYTVAVVDFVRVLAGKQKYVLADQLLRSCFGIAANVREAVSAASPDVFCRKVAAAAKEAEENKYWLQLCLQSRGLKSDGSLLEKLEPITRMLDQMGSTRAGKRLELAGYEAERVTN